MSRSEVAPCARLLRLGTRLWREGRQDRAEEEDETAETRSRDVEWTPDLVQASLEWVALRAALVRRRAIWLTRLVDATMVWSEQGNGARLIVIENGEIVVNAGADPGTPPPVPRGHRRSAASRHEAFNLASFDRLRVLTSELKRLVAAGAPVAVRFGDAPALAGARLASALSWV